jgi:hypothetical protein
MSRPGRVRGPPRPRQSSERGKQHPIRRRVPQPGDLAAPHRQLMAQHGDLVRVRLGPQPSTPSTRRTIIDPSDRQPVSTTSPQLTHRVPAMAPSRRTGVALLAEQDHPSGRVIACSGKASRMAGALAPRSTSLATIGAASGVATQG